ncbi:MAG: aminotransferase class III-fold pyridoxal phosphate-dependent enzyme [Pseudomonadota bacterium]
MSLLLSNTHSHSQCKHTTQQQQQPSLPTTPLDHHQCSTLCNKTTVGNRRRRGWCQVCPRTHGGAQEWYDVKPDLSTHGKVIGAGWPLSCIAGRADIIELSNPHLKGQPKYTYFNGTLHGNPVAAAATMAMLDELGKPGVYERMNGFADDLCRETQQLLDQHQIPAIAQNTGSLWQILFMDKTPRNQADVLASDQAEMRRLDTLLMKQGQYVLPGVRRFVSTAHTSQDLEDTLRGLDSACREFNRHG